MIRKLLLVLCLFASPAAFAADAKISALPSASTPLAGTEQFPINQGGTTKKATLNNIFGGSIGTATQVLHGNNTGFSAVNLATDVTGALNVYLNNQTGTAYTVLTTDKGLLVTSKNTSAVTFTVPDATVSLTTGFSVTFQNIGSSMLTLARTSTSVFWSNGSSGTTSIVVPPGYGLTLVSNGTDWFVSGHVFQVTQTLTQSGGTLSWDAGLGPVAQVTLSANLTTINAPTNMVAGQTYMLYIKVGSGAHYTYTGWNAAWKFSGGTAPTATATNDKVDIVTCGTPDGTNLYCNYVLNF